MELKFYSCEICGKIIAMVKDTGVPTICCGQPMKEIVPGSVDAAAEKHVPVVSVEGNIVTVEVGSVPHPMAEEHYIEWIVLSTKEGMQRKELNPGDEPKAEFALTDGDEVIGALAYCNLHSLWKSK
ncbi:desulfoferrodoxin family protein [Faecalicatena contorta]|uniref:Desulfoferrodoxin n=1 Tax=Faecalicatena contorta TaxID=39482 RepID=A0A316A4I0_9FIRM|nr:desulfoferrodoxin family protein [Faecalicatena contorta]PWJ52439.1 superoxide reductase [Faecalicatena contorta]SUQ12717.1 superoxide reductase [Faecalicatena contorta]